MPRRRMISPEFWTERKIGYLTRDERGFIVGCIGQADDDGRLQADPAFLKAEIYKYDDDLDSAAVKELRDSCLTKMLTWPSNHPYRMASYVNSDEEYIFFPNWYDIQKPSHPTKSKLPAPPPDLLPIFSSAPPEVVTNDSRATPPQSSLGQSSQGKDSLGQVSGVQEDFQNLLDNEKDLTDFLTTTLKKHMSAGRERVSHGTEAMPEKEQAVAAQWGMPVLEKFWTQATGAKLPGLVWHGAYSALHKYPAEVLAKAFVKAGPYGGGKHKSWKYIQTIIDEEMEKHGRSPPHK